MFVFFFLEATDGSLCRFGVLPLIESHLNEKNAVASLVGPDTAFYYFLPDSTRFDIGRKFSTRFDTLRHRQEVFYTVRHASTFQHLCQCQLFGSASSISALARNFLPCSTRIDTDKNFPTLFDTLRHVQPKGIHAPSADVSPAGCDYSLTLIFKSPKPSKRSASALSSAGSSFSSSAFSTACSACFFALACSCFASSAFRFYS